MSAERLILPPCLEPGNWCWRCGKLGELKCVEYVGWLCAPCRKPEKQRED